jgi:hypothetical protein
VQTVENFPETPSRYAEDKKDFASLRLIESAAYGVAPSRGN